MKTLVTGYAGFIGSNLTRMLLDQMGDGDQILGLDCKTYAARPLWVWDKLSDEDPRFIDSDVDIREPYRLQAVLQSFQPDRIYHLAAESHVCRSIDGPKDFATTNFMGTFNLIDALRKTNFKGRMVHVSTDEAFGSLRAGDEPFDERTAIDPTSPYSASKAASDLMVKSFAHTYGLDLVITRCTNNFGPNQHDEKLIPKAIKSLWRSEIMPIHGTGAHSRDWIFVDDHCRALMNVMEKGVKGNIYCIGSGYESSNVAVITRISALMREDFGWRGELRTKFTNDRPTDDARYAVDTTKIRQLGWGVDSGPAYFRQQLKKTIEWYINIEKEEE